MEGEIIIDTQQSQRRRSRQILLAVIVSSLFVASCCLVGIVVMERDNGDDGDDDWSAAATSVLRGASSPYRLSTTNKIRVRSGSINIVEGSTITRSLAGTTTTSTTGVVDGCNGLTRKQCIKSPECEFDSATAICSTSTTAVGTSGSGTEAEAQDADTIINNGGTEQEQIIDPCKAKLYHPTSITERKCSNNDIYPKMWNEDELMRSKYFFVRGEDCCNAFYNNFGTGVCEVENVCEAKPDEQAGTDVVVAGAAGSSTSAGVSSGGGEQDRYCMIKTKKKCVKDVQCKFDSNSNVCLGNGVIMADSQTSSGGQYGDNIPEPPTVSSALDCSSMNTVWHASVERGNTCTNDDNYPSSWNTPRQQRYHLFSTAEKCCEMKFYGQTCNVLDICDPVQLVGQVKTTPYPSTPYPISPSPTTPYPTTEMRTVVPIPTPVTNKPFAITAAKDGTTVDSSCYETKLWHKSRVPGHENKCTNDKRYPDAWLHPALKEWYLFDSIEECCQSNFKTIYCPIYDVCIEGTLPPTPYPTTSMPTLNPWPTYAPSVTNMYETADTTCNSRWHITNVKSHHSNTCTNDSNFPKEWREPSKRDYFLFLTADQCCKTLFPNEECHLYNICPEGLSQEPTEEPTTRAPTTSRPTKMPSKQPTPKPTRRPVLDVNWYVDRTSGKCVQSCEGNEPCGGIAPQWEEQYPDSMACCDSMPWTAYDVCLTTPSPTGPPPPTAIPTKWPTREPTGVPTVRPTFAPTTRAPTKAPTPVPTVDCSTYKWHMSTTPGEDMTCTNDDIIPEGWKQNAQFFLHDTGAICCQHVFGGNPNCKLRDWCGDINQDKVDEADRLAKEALAREAAAVKKTEEEAAAARAAAEAADAKAAADAAAAAEAAASFVEINGGDDDFEGGGSIPWDLGSPPQWKIDNTVASSGSHSMTNIPSTEVKSVHSLKLHMTTTTPGTIMCKIKVNISMPFERFSVHVNGKQRNIYYQPEDKWMNWATGFAPGDNSLEFRITNGDMFPEFDRSQQPRFGTGHVYVDDCIIRMKD